MTDDDLTSAEQRVREHLTAWADTEEDYAQTMAVFDAYVAAVRRAINDTRDDTLNAVAEAAPPSAPTGEPDTTEGPACEGCDEPIVGGTAVRGGANTLWHPECWEDCRGDAPATPAAPTVEPPEPPGVQRGVCPSCGKPHWDEGEWATRPHRTHLCVTDRAGEGCGHEWAGEYERKYMSGAELLASVRENAEAFAGWDPDAHIADLRGEPPEPDEDDPSSEP